MADSRNKVRMPLTAPRQLDLVDGAEKISQFLDNTTAESFVPVGTGFVGIDKETNGGLHSGDMWLLGGVQNVGKTAGIMSIARNIAAQKALAIVVCYEHLERELLIRLMCQEAFRLYGEPVLQAKHIEKAFHAVGGADKNKEFSGRSFDKLLQIIPHGIETWNSLSKVASKIWIVRGDTAKMTCDTLHAYVDQGLSEGNQRVVLIVDYLQKIPVQGWDGSYIRGDKAVFHTMNYLHNMSMSYANEGKSVSTLLVAAADMTSLRKKRIHFEGLGGPSTITYEPSCALIMNWDEYKEDGYPIIRWGLEKNRNGRTDIEFRHKYYGPAYYFDPNGEIVPEDESWQKERRAMIDENKEMKKMASLIAMASSKANLQ